MQNNDLSPGRWSFQRAREFIEATLTIVDLEARKLRHDPTELITRAVQPALWLLIFGNVFSKIRGIQTGNVPYLDFMAPGILAQSVLFMSIFYGIASIRDKDTGIIVKFLVSPAPRTALVLGKALAAGLRAMSQAVIVYIICFALGVHLNFHPVALIGVLLLVLLGAAFFSLFSLAIASLVKTQERFMGVGQLMTMPLFFASNALYPIAMMPTWLQVISHINPLTYQVDGLRALMLAQPASVFHPVTDCGILLAALIVMLAISGKLYGSLAS